VKATGQTARGFRSRNDALTARVHPHVRW
jgi:hypothetical protein